MLPGDRSNIKADESGKPASAERLFVAEVGNCRFPLGDLCSNVPAGTACFWFIPGAVDLAHPARADDLIDPSLVPACRVTASSPPAKSFLLLFFNCASQFRTSMWGEILASPTVWVRNRFPSHPHGPTGATNN